MYTFIYLIWIILIFSGIITGTNRTHHIQVAPGSAINKFFAWQLTFYDWLRICCCLVSK